MCEEDVLGDSLVLDAYALLALVEEGLELPPDALVNAVGDGVGKANVLRRRLHDDEDPGRVARRLGDAVGDAGDPEQDVHDRVGVEEERALDARLRPLERVHTAGGAGRQRRGQNVVTAALSGRDGLGARLDVALRLNVALRLSCRFLC